MSSRRNFLKLMATGTCGAMVHNVLSPAGSVMAYATPRTGAAVGSRPFVVFVALAGGVSYNITPIYNGTFYDRNPDISFTPEQSLPLSSAQGLHPSLDGLRAVYQEGKLAVVNMVGFPNPTRSHAEDMDIWQTGNIDAGAAQGGWAPRLTCQMGSALAGISLTGSTTLIEGDCNPPRALQGLDGFGERHFWGGEEGTQWLRMVRENVILDGAAPTSETHAFVRSSMLSLDQSLSALREYTEVEPPNPFPTNTGFGRQCRDAARLMMASNVLDTRFVFLEIGGFDTHEDERPRLTELLTTLDDGLSALVQTAKLLGRFNDLVIVTFSEFSRTWQNGVTAKGSDHGHSVPVLIAGGGVRGGILTPPPTTNEITEYDYLRGYRVDFRQLFGEVIAGMGYNPLLVFPQGYSSSGHIGIFT